MKMTLFKKVLSFILCMVLITAIALISIGCNDNNDEGSSTPVQTQSGTKEDEVKLTEIGEGETEFNFNVTDQNGKVSKFLVKTGKTTVGEALLEVALIAGEDSQYGLYVKTVNGITLDYDKDGKYWAFYIDGEMAMSGVDSTDVTEGATYEFKAE